ncbi:hypothetical protein [Tepidibacter hydrothermalis]|uniref:Uncharacterized protein n=1 Tax=Tepidibacter hydrothermalis TaxID=3036126 RepID=A0ABY8EAM7_9FIRM|nr:hypothetical protein [Tepidibacter hydrothermalis]WFD09954.1 hypothetical protein P4S50_16490 [Tepidibacter hydrothermalis]
MNIEQRLKELIQEKTVESTFNELKKQRMLKSTRQTAFQKTETLLYNYPKFENVLKSKLEEIETIEKEGISKRSKSFVQWSSSNNYDNSNEYEKSMNAIQKIKASIVQIEGYISQIDAALNIIKDDPYYELIPMKYFEGQTREDIAYYFEVDVKTIDRHKNRLVNLLKIRLFSDECIEELLG